jgi:hypothetical protein
MDMDMDMDIYNVYVCGDPKYVYEVYVSYI